MVRFLFLAFLSLALQATAGAQNWPAFRGPNSSGVSSANKLPLTWNAETGENVRWKTAIPGLGHSSPVIWGDQVFVTTSVGETAEGFQADASGGRNVVADADPRRWKVYCLGLRNGEILWERIAHQGIPRVKRHARSSHANATPATDGTYLAVFFGSEGLYVYNLDGDLLWKRDLGVLDAGYVGLPEYQWESASSPLIYRDLVIVQADSRRDSFVAAFKSGTGEEVWRSPRDENPSWATPVIARADGRDILVTSSPNYFRGLDPLTGKEIWRFHDGADVKVPTPVAANGMVYFSGGAPQGRQFYAIRPDGRGDISSQPPESNPHFVWRVAKGGPYTPTPIAYGEHLYVLGDNGILSCYRAATGEPVYRRRVPESGGTYSASPVAAMDRLYLTNSEGVIYVVQAGAEFKLLAANEMGEALLATPALTEGMILVRTRSHLIAIVAG